jgi:hypothetical protein
MGVEKFLDASTGHITYEDSLKLLEDPVSFPCRVIPHVFGWWINVPEMKLWVEEPMADWIREQGYSEGIISMLIFARDNNCWWVNLDRDGEQIEELEEFEW